MKDAVDLSVAQDDISAWLDKKKISENTRLAYKDAIDMLVGCVVSGSLTVDEDGIMTYTLGFPFDVAGTPVSQLSFQNRLSIDTIKAKTATLKPGDSDGRVLAYASALTGQQVAVLGKMDSSDYSVVQNIVVFFMSK